MTSAIYAIKQISTGKLYIGSSIDTQKRWREHRNDLYCKEHYNAKLQRAWNKYGESDFLFRILDYVDQEELIVAEQQWLDTAKPYFNICPVAGSPLGSVRERITHCKRDHAFTPENTYINAKGHQVCKECRKLNQRAHYKSRPYPQTLFMDCPEGHPYSGENLYINTNGGRECLICKRARQARYAHKKRLERLSHLNPSN